MIFIPQPLAPARSEDILIIGGSSGVFCGVMKNERRFLSQRRIVSTFFKSTSHFSGPTIFFDIREPDSLHIHLRKIGLTIPETLVISVGVTRINEEDGLKDFSAESASLLFSLNVFKIIELLKIIIEHTSNRLKVYILSSSSGSISDRGMLPHHSRGGPISYRASKAALNMFVKCLSFDFSGTHSFYLLHPGFVQTASNNPSGTVRPSEFQRRLFEFIHTGHYDVPSGSFYDLIESKFINW